MEMRDLERLALAQGWDVGRTRAGHVQFRSPDGASQVYVAASKNEARALANAIADLRRGGLDIPRAGGPKKEETVAQKQEPAPATDRVLSDALDAAVQMIEELAGEFTQFRKYAQGELVELRGKAKALEVAAAAVVTQEQIAAMAREFDKRLDEMARKADPIGAFRARLRAE